MAASIIEPDYDPANPSFRQVLDVGLSLEKNTVGAYGDLGYFRASSMGYCLRRQVYDRAGLVRTKADDAKGLRTLSLGNVYHYWLQKRLTLGGLMLQDELEMVDPYGGVSGHVDAVWGGLVNLMLSESEVERWSPRYQEWVGQYRRALSDLWPAGVPVTATEFKSAADYSIKKMYEEGPSFQHKHQVGTYWWLRNQLLLSDETDPDLRELLGMIERFMLTIVGKGDMSMIEFELRPDQAEQTAERIARLLGFWKDAKLPPCSCGKDLSWEPRYCAYRDPDDNSKTPLCCDPRLFDQIDWDRIRDLEDEQMVQEVKLEEVARK